MEKDVIRIAVLDHSHEIGGAEASILTLLKNIDKSRFDVTVILPSRGSFSEELNRYGIKVNVIHLPIELVRLKRGNFLRAFLFMMVYLFHMQIFLTKLCTFLKNNKFHLILTNTVKAHLYGSIAAYFCSIPLIWRFHDILSPTDFSPLLIKCITFFGKLFPRRILAVSTITRDYLAKNGFNSSKIEIIFNGIDNELFKAQDISKNFRNELNIENGVKLVGCIGRIVPQKGQKSFVLAIPGVVKKYPETFFLIIGDIFLKEEAYKKELFEMIRRIGLEDRVKFAGFRTDIGDIIRSLDIVVFPSVAPEAFPLAISEAMSLGKPVIASNVGGVCEIIEDGITGILVEPNHPEQITHRIIYLLSHKEIYDKIGEEAKETVRKKFSLIRYIAAMEKAFEEVALREGNA